MKGKISNGLWCRIGCGLRLALAGLRDLFFVRECAVCGEELESEHGGVRQTVESEGQDTGRLLQEDVPATDGGHLCDSCMADIPLTYFWNYSGNAAIDRLAGRCHVYNAAALFFYRHDSDYCELVRRFKYGGDTALGLWAARMLGEYMAVGGLYSGVQAVVPVPLHWRKRFRRGFNQAEIVARGIAERLPAGYGSVAADDCRGGDWASGGCAFGGRVPRGLPVVTNLLFRRRYTRTQTRRQAGQRVRNVAGAFGIRSREIERLRVAGVRHVLLVDDVVTTGATIAECVRLLEPCFTVSVATLGFVE